MQQELMLEETPRQSEGSQGGKTIGRRRPETASTEGIRRVCLAAAISLDREASDGIARCVCCGKTVQPWHVSVTPNAEFTGLRGFLRRSGVE